MTTESPREELKRKLLAHSAATQFDVVPFVNYVDHGYSGPTLRVMYWSEKHQEGFSNLLELKGKDALLDLLPADTIDSIVNSFNHAADDALVQGPDDKVLE